MSAMMLARIGPVKPFLDKPLITHGEACGRTGRPANAKPRARSEACAASAGARLRVGAHMYVSAVSAKIVDGKLPENRFSLRYLYHNGLLRTPDSAGRPHGGGGGAYKSTSLVSTVMLARIGPLKPFLDKPLITHGEACGRTGRPANAKPHARSEACAASAGARLRMGAHMYVSAVSAESVDGTLPIRPGYPAKTLKHRQGAEGVGQRLQGR